MNKLTLIICLYLLIVIKSEGQNIAEAKPKEPPKKSNKIIVLVKDLANTLMIK